MSETREIQRAYRVVLDPTSAQEEALARHAGAARAAFNHALAAKIDAHRAWQTQVAWATYDPDAPTDPAAALAAARKAIKTPSPSYAQNIVSFKASHDWYGDVNLYAISTGCRAADTAWKNWLDSWAGRRRGRAIGYPRFKKKGRARDSFSLYHDVKKPALRADGYRRLNLPVKVGGSIRVKGNLRRLARRVRRGHAVIASVTISRHGHRWVASILAREILTITGPTRAQRARGTVGVDLGVKVFAALSTGELIANPRPGARAARRLTRAQRALSRTGWWRERDGALTHNPKDRTSRKTPTRRRVKAQARVARLHALLAEQRAQNAHRLTKRLATAYAVVAIEDLNVAGMSRSAKGTPDAPGANVAAKAGLTRNILDAAFGETRRQLTYKTSWYGSELALTSRFAPTSRTCATCGWRHPSLTLTVRVFTCPTCGPVDRDVNAARNIAAWAIPADTATQPLPVAPEKEETQNARRALAHRAAPAARRASATTREDPPPGGPPRPSNRARPSQTYAKTGTPRPKDQVN